MHNASSPAPRLPRPPRPPRYELLEEGEPAELLVLSDSPEFESFRAVKDVYLPQAGLWLSEYPYCDRTALLDVSLAQRSGLGGAGVGSAGGAGQAGGQRAVGKAG